MIISASRRTDIPAFYPDWMMRRLREGYALVRNPFSAHQVSRVSLRKEDAELIVFWTKDAANMLPFLDELDDTGIKYLFQYTLTPYGNNIERSVDKRRAQDCLLKLAERLGPGRVIWRYDPILLTEDWTPARHIRAFETLSGRLEGAAERCVISFVDLYRDVRRAAPFIAAPGEQDMREMAREMAACARRRGMIPSACAEAADLTGEGLEARGCIDPGDVSAVLGVPVAAPKDTGQRTACRCMKSIDIGAYGTCGHGCVYCYAGGGRRRTRDGDADSPLLGSLPDAQDRVSERKEKKIAADQLSVLNW